MGKQNKKTPDFNELANKTNLFRSDEEIERVPKNKEEADSNDEKVEIKKNTLKSKKLGKGEKSFYSELISTRNNLIKDSSSNLIAVSDLSKEILEYIFKSLDVGKKELVDALIIDFYLSNKDLIKKEAVKNIKNKEINL